MKHVFFLTAFFLTITLSGFSQTPYEVEANVLTETAPSDARFAEYDKYYKIYRSMYNDKWEQIKTEEDLSEQDRKYMQKMRDKYAYLDDSAPWEVIGPGCSWYCGAHYEMNASSTLASQGENSYAVKNLWDDDVRSAWVEGVKGYGIGEYITFDFTEDSPRATRCILVNGYSKNQQTWKNNSRVKTLHIYENDKLVGIAKLKDTRCVQMFDLKNHRPNKQAMQLKFMITEVYKGDKYDDTAISELVFDGIDVHCLGKGSLITLSNGTKKAIEEIMIGDSILSYNVQTKEMTSDVVKQIHEAIHSDLIKITLSNGESIIATEDHPFLSKKGRTSYSPKKTKQYERYKNTTVSRLSDCKTLLFYENGSIVSKAIQKIEFIKDSQLTYTLELEKEGDFIANGFVVGQE